MGRGIDLDRLADALRQRYGRRDPPLRVTVSNAGRQLIVVPNGGAAERSQEGVNRSGRCAPPGNAFELYVSVESPADAAASARMAPPAQDGTELKVEPGRPSQMWTLHGPGEDRIVIRLRRGEAVSDEDARGLMRIVAEAIR